MRWSWIVVVAAAVACSNATPPAKTETKPEDRHQPQTAPSKLVLEVVAGGTTTTWHEGELAKVAKIVGTASDGEARDTWSLRELARTLIGPTARIETVIGPDGQAT